MLGIVGLVLTITVWIGPICDVLAIVFGAMGARRLPEGAPNGGMATAGIILGIVGLALTCWRWCSCSTSGSATGEPQVVHAASAVLG